MSETTTGTGHIAESAAPPVGPEADSTPRTGTAAPAAGEAQHMAEVPDAITTPEGEGAPAAGTPRKDRRVLRAVGRWAAAVTVFGLLGTGVAYGITEQERTDIPGLATEHDGRWDYPELTLPALPSGAPRPFADGNVGEIHHADVRDLLLPAPEGATAAEDGPGIDGEWTSIESFAGIFTEEHRAEVEQRLTDDAVRHIAARGWTMPDGTRTSIHLLQFNSAAYTGDFYSDILATPLTPRMSVVGARASGYDESWPQGTLVPNVSLYPFDEEKPRGEEHVRQAYLTAGDIVAVVVQSRKGTAPAVPFRQTVILQAQLLG